MVYGTGRKRAICIYSRGPLGAGVFYGIGAGQEGGRLGAVWGGVGTRTHAATKSRTAAVVALAMAWMAGTPLQP